MKLKQTLAATAAIGALALAAAGPATATGNTYTVSVGGSSAPAVHQVTASAPSTVQWQVPTLSMTCASAAVPATPPSIVTSGSGVTDVLAINKVNFTGCAGPGGAFALPSAGTWSFHGTSAATPGSSDVLLGHLENVSFKIRNAICDVTVTGSASASFDEATQVFMVNETGFTGNLKVSNVRGCLGQIVNGQNFNLRATFNVASVDGAINLS